MIRPDAAPGALLLLVLAVTVTLVVGVVVWLDALVLAVLSARLCGVLPGDGTHRPFDRAGAALLTSAQRPTRLVSTA